MHGMQNEAEDTTHIVEFRACALYLLLRLDSNYSSRGYYLIGLVNFAQLNCVHDSRCTHSELHASRDFAMSLSIMFSATILCLKDVFRRVLKAFAHRGCSLFSIPRLRSTFTFWLGCGANSLLYALVYLFRMSTLRSDFQRNSKWTGCQSDFVKPFQKIIVAYSGAINVFVRQIIVLGTAESFVQHDKWS